MKSKISFTALLCLFSICLSSCESDLNVDVSQKEQNIELLRSIADSMGCNVEIELFNRQATEPLTALDIEKFKAKFKKIILFVKENAPYLTFLLIDFMRIFPRVYIY